MSFPPTTIGNGVAILPNGTHLRVGATVGSDTQGEIGIRAEHVLPVGSARADLLAKVDVVEPPGSDTLVRVLVEGTALTVRLPGNIVPAHSDTLPLSVPK